MKHQTLKETKELLWNEIKEILDTEDNIEALKEYKYKSEVKEQDITKLNIVSNTSDSMLDDIIVDKIVNYYMPTSYDDMIEWTREEPLLIYTLVPTSRHRTNPEAIIFHILSDNILNYLKRFVYREIEGWVRGI